MNWLMTLCAESIYIIENFMIIFAFVALLEYKGKHLKTSIVGQVLFIYLFQKVSTPLSIALTGENKCSVIANILMLVMITVILYRGTFWRRTFAILIYLGPALLAEALAWPLIHKIIMRIEGFDAVYQVIYSVTEYRNLATILCGQIILILWVMMLLLWKVFMDNWWIKEYLLFIIIPIYQLIIFLIYYNSCERIDVSSIVIGWFLYIFGIGIDVAILYLITSMLKRIKLEKELSELYQKRKKELDYYVQVNEHMENVRELRHEFANQLQVIYGLMEEKDTDKVKMMLDAMHKNMELIFADVKDEVNA